MTTFGLFVGTWIAAADQQGPFYRYATRYTASLEQKLRPMFIFTKGDVIAYGQLAAAFLVLSAHVILTIDFWYVGIFFIAVGPTAYIEYIRRQRVEKIEEQLDNFMLALGQRAQDDAEHRRRVQTPSSSSSPTRSGRRSTSRSRR